MNVNKQMYRRKFLTSFPPSQIKTMIADAKIFAAAHVVKENIPPPSKDGGAFNTVKFNFDRIYQMCYLRKSRRHLIRRSIFFDSIKNFYKTMIVEIQIRFDCRDKALEVVKLVIPTNARKLSPSDLSEVFNRFPVSEKLINDN